MRCALSLYLKRSRVCFNRCRKNFVLEVLNQNSNNGVKRSPAFWTGLFAFWSYRAFFFGSAFFCAELFFLVGLFFLGSAVFFGIDLNLRLVNYLLMATEYFFPFLHIVLSEAATVQPNSNYQRYAFKGKSILIKVRHSDIYELIQRQPWCRNLYKNCAQHPLGKSWADGYRPSAVGILTKP